MVESQFLIPVLLQLIVWALVLGGGSYLALRLVRALERRGSAPAELSALQERVRVLEENNVRLEAELAQIADAQRFTTALLAERSTAGSQ